MLNHSSSNKAIEELNVQLNKEGNDEREDACFVAEITMQSIFSWSEEMDQKEVEFLLEKNAPALLLSYARPIIASITASSPLATFNIPFINMNEVFERAAQQEELPE